MRHPPSADVKRSVAGATNALAARLAVHGELMLAAARSLACALRSRGAVEVILFGSLARGITEVGPTSDVDMVVVMPGMSGERLHRRLADVSEVTDFPYPLDLFVYTPEEWESAMASPFISSEILGGGVSLGE